MWEPRGKRDRKRGGGRGFRVEVSIVARSLIVVGPPPPPSVQRLTARLFRRRAAVSGRGAVAGALGGPRAHCFAHPRPPLQRTYVAQPARHEDVAFAHCVGVCDRGTRVAEWRVLRRVKRKGKKVVWLKNKTIAPPPPPLSPPSPSRGVGRASTARLDTRSPPSPEDKQQQNHGLGRRGRRRRGRGRRDVRPGGDVSADDGERGARRSLLRGSAGWGSVRGATRGGPNACHPRHRLLAAPAPPPWCSAASLSAPVGVVHSVCACRACVNAPPSPPPSR